MKQEKSFLQRIIKDDKGAIAAWFALCLPIFIGMGAVALDWSYALMIRQKLQISASSAALAGAAGLVEGGNVEAVLKANDYADRNAPGAGDIMPGVNDVQTGTFDFSTRAFSQGATPENAVKVFAHLSENTNNPISLYLSGIFGRDTANVNVSATAVVVGNPPVEACIITLNPDPDRLGLTLGGNSSISGDDCGICVNSTRPLSGGPNGGALTANGNPEINVGALGAIIVAGGYSATGGVSNGDDCDTYDICPEVDENVAYTTPVLCPDPIAFEDDGVTPAEYPDPYRDVLEDVDPCSGTAAHGQPIQPATGIPSSTITNPDGVPDTGTLFEPGVYCGGIDIGGGESVYFETGEYYIMDRTNAANSQLPDGNEVRLDVNGMSGNGRYMNSADGGITFVFSGPEAYWSQENAVKNAQLTGLRIDPNTGLPTGDSSGDPSFLVYQDPLNPSEPPNTLPTAQHNVNGGTDFFMDGILYFGMQDVRIRGSIQHNQQTEGGCLAILAGQVDMSGGPDISLATGGCSQQATIGPETFSVRLVN